MALSHIQTLQSLLIPYCGLHVGLSKFFTSMFVTDMLSEQKVFSLPQNKPQKEKKVDIKILLASIGFLAKQISHDS